MTSLVIAEHDNTSIKGATLNTVTAALACGGDVHVLVAGANAGAAAAQAAQIAGVSKVIHADGAPFAHGLAENVAAQVLAIAGAYSHILFPATAGGKNVAPRVAAKLDVAQISDITKVEAADTFERPIYAGNAIAIVQSADATKVITVRTTGFDPAAATGGSAAVETVAGAADSGKSTFLGSEIAKNDRPDLTAAKIVVSGGRALGSAEKFNEVMTPLADKLGAAIGASRAAVDAGYAANDLQGGLRTGGRPFRGRAGTGQSDLTPVALKMASFAMPFSYLDTEFPRRHHELHRTRQGHAVQHRASGTHRPDRADPRIRGRRARNGPGRAGGVRQAQRERDRAAELGR